jgi:hypothetical protein
VAVEIDKTEETEAPPKKLPLGEIHVTTGAQRALAANGLSKWSALSAHETNKDHFDNAPAGTRYPLPDKSRLVVVTDAKRTRTDIRTEAEDELAAAPIRVATAPAPSRRR